MVQTWVWYQPAKNYLLFSLSIWFVRVHLIAAEVPKVSLKCVAFRAPKRGRWKNVLRPCGFRWNSESWESCDSFKSRLRMRRVWSSCSGSSLARTPHTAVSPHPLGPLSVASYRVAALISQTQRLPIRPRTGYLMPSAMSPLIGKGRGPELFHYPLADRQAIWYGIG